MKLGIFSSVILAAVLSGNSLALTSITEPFTGTTLNASRWYEYHVGTGGMTQAGGLLNFVMTSNPAKDAYSSLELSTSRPSANESWQITADLSNSTKIDKGTGIGFMIFNAADRHDYFYLEFLGPSGFAAGAFLNSREASGRLAQKVALTKGSFRIRYDKSSHLMSLSHSPTDSAAGYKWTTIGTFSPTGKGGNINANWQMEPAAGQFGIQLYGRSAATAIKTGKLTVDNFRLKAIP